jgi:membrane protein
VLNLPKTPPLADLLRLLWRRFDDDRCMQIAASLTFTTLLALVPIITVALTLMSAFPVFAEMMVHLEEFLVENVLPESARTVVLYTQMFAENAAKLTALGLIFLFITSIIVLMTIDQAFNEIWRVPRPRNALQRVFIYWTLLTLGPILIGASLSLTSWVVSVSMGLVKDIPYAGKILLRVAPMLLTGCAFALLYSTLPNRRVLVRDALTGGFLAAAAFEAMKFGFAVYITQFPTYTLVYGAFAAVPIFLLWIYLSWLVVLLGAAAVAVLPEWRERTPQSAPAPGSQFLDALQVLRLLWEAQREGEPVRERRLHGAVKLPIDRLEAMLDTMRAAGWVERSGRGWALTREASEISAADVYRQFVFRGSDDPRPRQSGHELDRLASSLAGALGENFQLSLAELFERAEPAARQGEAGT